jgi:large subunit ribosomal protein L21
MRLMIHSDSFPNSVVKMVSGHDTWGDIPWESSSMPSLSFFLAYILAYTFMSPTAYAIVETCGKQYWFQPGRYYDINFINAEPGDKIIFHRVLWLQHQQLLIGRPFLPNTHVEATILQHLKSKKVLVYHMRSKKKTRKKYGARQLLTRIYIHPFHGS